MRVLAVADSDSYVKWGAAALGRMPSEFERTFVVVETPFVPTTAQLEAAVENLDGIDSAPEVVSIARVRALAAELQPDVVFLSLRGPLIRVVLREVLSVTAVRPIFVSGLPGISIPATRKALMFRSQVDLFVLHSKHEIREFSALAERVGIEQTFGLNTLPFLNAQPERSAAPDEIVFAVQAKVPSMKFDRDAILDRLIETANAHPELRVVIKLRAAAGENQTHWERHPYDRMLAEREDVPANLVTEVGSMGTHLANAVGLVTVSSTALIEAAAIGVPAIALDDFGVREILINTVFEGSNLLAGSDELVAGRFRQPAPEWLDDNYFHPASDNDWTDVLKAMVVDRALRHIPLRRLAAGRAGGRLRYIWDRKRALGSLDTSVAGYVALAIGYPARAVYKGFRRTRRRVLRLGRPASEQTVAGIPSA